MVDEGSLCYLLELGLHDFMHVLGVDSLLELHVNLPGAKTRGASHFQPEETLHVPAAADYRELQTEVIPPMSAVKLQITMQVI